MLALDRGARLGYVLLRQAIAWTLVGLSTARHEPRQARKGATVVESGCDRPFPFCARAFARIAPRAAHVTFGGSLWSGASSMPMSVAKRKIRGSR